ncbi:MAG: hypothetical protein MZV70_08785 [Desulfobacterales bacterium]|nr:hypothetical protein [Desulfobacterales bacterium]
MTAPADGTYFVEVRAAGGASMYNLTIGQTGTGGGYKCPRLSDEFVPGEVIVRFHGPQRGIQRGRESPAAIGMNAKAGAPGREMLLDDRRRQRLAADAGRLLGIPAGRSSVSALPTPSCSASCKPCR